MKRLFGRTAFNAVYFFVAISCAAWFVLTYGLGSAAAIAVCTIGVFYGILFCASLSERCLHGTFFTPLTLSKRWSKAIRFACLSLPVIALSYIGCFYFVCQTYCWDGGVNRFNAFSDMEVSLFKVPKASPVMDAAIVRSLEHYMNDTFNKWAKSHWHPLHYDDSGETICSFHVHRDGRIHNVRISQSSGNPQLDIDALVALDGVAPSMPLGTPDWTRIQFTFAYNVFGEKPAVRPDPWGTDAFDQGKWYGHRGDYAKAVEALNRSLEIRQSVMKDGDANITDVHLALADTYSSLGLIKKSNFSFSDAVGCAELGADKRPDYLIHSLSEYATKAYATQQYKKCVPLFERIRSLSRGELDREDRIRLAQSLYVTGEHERAFKEFDAVLKSDEADKTGAFADNLNWERLTLIKLYLKDGDRKKAIGLMDSALAQADKSKKRNELRKDLLLGFGEIYSTLDGKSERNHLQSALAEFTANFGPLDPDTNYIRSQFASFEKKHGNQKSADDLYSQLVNRFGKNHPDRANALFHQGDYYFENGRKVDAERVLREALEIRTRLYKADDSRVSSIKNGLFNVLRAQGKNQEADSLSASIVASADENSEDVFTSLLRDYESSGKHDKALAALDQVISKSLKTDPEDRVGERSNNYDRAIKICRNSHDDKRLEKYLKDNYASEFKRQGSSSWHPLIAFYIERKQYSQAEELAHKEVSESLNGRKDWFPRFRAEEAARAFIDLAHVNELQGRRSAARDYIGRAVALVEPNGRSGCHAHLVGLLAQHTAADGEVGSAQRLLNGLLENQLSDTSGGVYFDPVSGFSTSGCFGSQSIETCSYAEHGSKRSDPSLSTPRGFGSSFDELTPAPVAPLAMSNVDWSASDWYETDFCYLRASTLLALASFQDSSGEHQAANESRNQSLDCIQQFIESSEMAPAFRNYDLYDPVFAKLPPSQRLKELKARFERVKAKPGLDDISACHS